MATVASTVTLAVTKTITTTAASATSTLKVNPQGGVFEGRNPTHYEVKDPIALFIIQAAIVIGLTRILHWPLSFLRQPRVIAEVITGIILGPSIMGRIPHFTTTVFPTASMPAFTLAANIGLVMFLFLVGLEVDLRFLISNWRVALTVGAAGMAIPFGLGVGLAWGLYHEFHNDANTVPISFGIYALFIGVALAITAFPVLCRILTALKLLGTDVGIIVLSAGVANDVVGWILLALCVALVNSGAGLTALYIFLVAVGYSLFLAYAVRPVFLWILRKSGSLDNGPSEAIVALTVFLVLASAFFTDIIGVHAIFGAFMVGLICPHESGFAIKLAEKIEDLISVLFVPLYFALSGLSTNLGLLNTGMTWAYVIGVTAVAFFGKVIGGTLASRAYGLYWRESATIGVLMSCKGLVELIVLNIGLQARILSTRTFTIFVVMALLTTFATTPLTSWLYPDWYQEKVTKWRRADWNGDSSMSGANSPDRETSLTKTDVTNSMLVYLRLDSLPSLFNIVSLFTAGSPRRRSSVASSTQSVVNEKNVTTILSSPSPSQEKPFYIRGIRPVELTQRNSSVMKVSELEECAMRDPIIRAFGTSTVARRSVRDVKFSGEVAVVPGESFPSTLAQRARELRTDFVLVPWSEDGTTYESSSLFGPGPITDPLSNSQYASLTTKIFEQGHATAHVGVYLDASILAHSDTAANTSHSQISVAERPARWRARSLTGLSGTDAYNQPLNFHSAGSRGRRQIRTLYRGTQDDLLAIKMALQLARNEEVEVRIVKIAKSVDGDAAHPSAAVVTESDDLELANLACCLPDQISSRVHIEELKSADLDTVTSSLLLNQKQESGPITLLLGRSSMPLTHTSKVPYSNELAKTLGPQATGLLPSIKELGGGVSILVVQAKKNGDMFDPSQKEGRYSMEAE